MVGLYPSIPYSEDLSAIREALGRRLDPVVAIDTLFGLASVVLSNNCWKLQRTNHWSG